MDSPADKDLCCPVCCEVFRDPVVLSCSHSFCKVCVKSWWREKPTRECPLCQRRSSRTDPPCNLVLKNLCESFLERGQRSSEDLCSLHSEKLKLFCLDHQQPVCLVCRDSEKHTDHKFKPIDEAVREPRRTLQETLEPLKEKLKVFKQAKVKFGKTAAHIRAQARLTEKQIKEQFKKLHQFLEEEEEARLSALREEEQQKSQRMKEQMEALSRDLAALSDTVRDTEEQLRAGDVSFLKNYKVAAERVQQAPLLEDPHLPSGALIDQAKHLGNLSFNIWNKMKDLVSYRSVILDPNTLGPLLSLSDDLTTTTRIERLEVIGNPERRLDVTVMGYEGYNSGIHSWDIEVGTTVHAWLLGLSPELPQGKTDNKSEFWGLGFCGGKLTTHRPTAKKIPLAGAGPVQTVRVKLDWDKGELSFSDPDTGRHMYTLKHTFTEKMYPLFCSVEGLKICPQKVCVKVRSDSLWFEGCIHNELEHSVEL